VVSPSRLRCPIPIVSESRTEPMTYRIPTYPVLLVALGAGTLSGCVASSDDTEEYYELDRLRVLGVRSTPADLVTGETATLSALVFEPKDRAVEYAWSWCPSRADASGGFECTIDEAELRKAWAETGSELELPDYDLGTEPEAQFFNAIVPEAVPLLCQALTKKSKDQEQAQLACLLGLEVSVQLVVKSAGKSITAFKTLTLLPEDSEASARNLHPQLSESVTVRDIASSPPKTVTSLQAGHRYKVTAALPDESVESFVPTPTEDDPKPEARQETLIMSWFVTDGSYFAPESPDGPGGAFGGDRHTTFVDGQNELEDVLTNGWELPLTAGPEDARLFLVLRDERGGVSWSEHRFAVKESR
jgi:hypothetical protein